MSNYRGHLAGASVFYAVYLAVLVSIAALLMYLGGGADRPGIERTDANT